MFLAISTMKKLLGSYTENESQKNQAALMIEKVIKNKGNKLYVKWKGYDN